MGLEQKYIKDKGYDVENDFLEALENIDRALAAHIVIFLEENVFDYKPKSRYPYFLGGLVHYNNEAITFAVQIVKESGNYITLSDLKFISMDYYLDLMLKKKYIKDK